MSGPDTGLQPPRILITPGEPAGIGPDLVCAIAQENWPVQLVAVADPALLRERAAALKLTVDIVPFDPAAPRTLHRAGRLPVWPVALEAPAVAGTLDVRNARYVLRTLEVAADACVAGNDGLRNHLAVRDHLRGNPAAARAYGSLKKQLAARFADDIDGKTEFILDILARTGFSPDQVAGIRAINRKPRGAE